VGWQFASALEQLSRLTPDNDRLSRAISQARDDAQAGANSMAPGHHVEREAASAALDGSLQGIADVCRDLGL